MIGCFGGPKQKKSAVRPLPDCSQTSESSSNHTNNAEGPTRDGGQHPQTTASHRMMYVSPRPGSEGAGTLNSSASTFQPKTATAMNQAGPPTAYEEDLTKRWNKRRMNSRDRNKSPRSSSSPSRRRSSFEEYVNFLGLEDRIGIEKVKEWKKVFVQYDVNGTGKISGVNCLSCLRQLGFNPTVHRLIELLNNLDEDGSSGTTFVEKRKIDQKTMISFFEVE